MADQDRNPLTMIAMVFGLVTAGITIGGAWFANALVPVNTKMDAMQVQMIQLQTSVTAQIKDSNGKIEYLRVLVSKVRDEVANNKVRITDLKRIYGFDSGYKDKE